MEDLKDLADQLNELTDEQKTELEAKHGIKVQTNGDPVSPPTGPKP